MNYEDWANYVDDEVRSLREEFPELLSSEEVRRRIDDAFEVTLPKSDQVDFYDSLCISRLDPAPLS